MEATVNVKCPYCECPQRVLLHVREYPDSASRPECVLCDNECGGCDKWFVVSVVTRYEVTTATISSEVEHKVWVPRSEVEENRFAVNWQFAPDDAEGCLMTSDGEVLLDWIMRLSDMDADWIAANGYKFVARPAGGAA